ncbi:putative vacuolar atp synthase subunit c [Phaeomoniella chlamydospora]|uniref:V-type proton ATPase subunit C n=1 Tax=Phaeomoniella chlamydospora TaxID=158046 RepID=A0A0G2GZX4_PHACM|nr:putative vacuolar atp synthase subunit c [Phaeomoniella chlamydospora]
MSKEKPSYLFVTVPNSVVPSGHTSDALAAVQNAAAKEGTALPITIPEFKIGTLDALVQQADELAKLQNTCESVVAKVGDALKNVLDGDQAKIESMKVVNDKPLEQYLRTFTWNKVKYRADKPLSELIDLLQKETQSIDNDVRSRYQQYNTSKSNLAALQRKQTGNLSTKSLISIVDPKLLVQNSFKNDGSRQDEDDAPGSEYIETHLIAVPLTNQKDFLKNYETLSPMVVPRSATLVTQDSEFALYSATTFKKHSQEFLHKCREHKWVPRDFKYKEGGKEEEAREVERSEKEERRLWGETLRMARTGWSESVMCWVHAIILRVFVETVLRYGLPLDFTTALIKTTPKQASKVRSGLDAAFSYLGGNAFGRDKKGRVTKDDSAVSAELQAAGHMGDGNDYTAYVCYGLEVD